MKKYGNIVFGEQGLEMVVNYSAANDKSFDAEKRRKDEIRALECAKDYVRGRMKHCIKELNQNAYKAKVITPESVIWDKGHFERPVYDAMADIEKVTSWDELNNLQLQQVIRALHFNSCDSDKYYGESRELAFNIATECMLMRTH